MNVTKGTRVHEPELVLDNRSGKQQPRREFRDRLLTTIPAGNKVGYVETIVVTNALAIHAYDATGRLSEFRGIVREVHIDALDCINRDVCPQTSGRRIRYIQAVKLVTNLIGT